MANIYKSNYTGAKVDEAIKKVLNAAPEASDELQKKLKQIINLSNYDFSTITNGTNKGITDLNADLASIGSSVQGPIIQFLGTIPNSALSDTSLVVFPDYSTIIGLKTTTDYTSGHRMTFTNATGSHVTFVRCYFDCFGTSDIASITRINNPVDYHFVDCTFNGSYTAALYIVSNSNGNNLVFDHCTFTPSSYPTSDIPGCILLSSCNEVTFNNCSISNNRGGSASGQYTDYCFYNMNGTGNWYINTCYNSVTGKPISESDVYLINNGIISPSLPEPVSYVSTMPTADANSPSLVFLMGSSS